MLFDKLGETSMGKHMLFFTATVAEKTRRLATGIGPYGPKSPMFGMVCLIALIAKTISL